ncbi:phage tail tape measure protein [Vagococcus carniphilus]|uniref:phage tail tape measure protein n=1 Tax=Vagococcus carniphilus TaxID=218144 RepID=UPI0028911000|nr:phage tail tape measure protein [Vagococcus carniphilus]MDT2815979.1 phage tail tape measure protein [Vagococcus carniphilus]
MARYGKPLGNMVIDLGINDSAFRKGLEGSKQATRYWMSEMKATLKVMDTAGDRAGALKSKQDGLTKVIESQKEHLAALTQRYKESYDEQGNASKKTLDYARDVRNAEAKLAGFEKQLIAVNREIKISESTLINSGKQIESFGKGLSKQGKVVSDFGSSLTKAFTLPVGLFIGGSIKAAMDFESAFAGVRKTVDASEEEFKALSDGFKRMSQEIPVSASALSELGESAGQLGIKTPNIEKFVRVVADLGVATNIVGEEGAQMIAKFANITNMPQTDFDRFGSSIVDLGNNFATTEQSILEMSMRLAGAGHQIGMSQADILGVSTALSSLGIEAEMGGSAFSKVMINMKVASVMGLEQMRQLEAQTGMTRRELELLKNHDGEAFKDIAINLGMTTTEMTKIMKAGKDLEGFSKIAGMTGDEFKKAFEEDAVGAIGAFVNGLGSAEEKGTTAIELLDEMGIKEVRLRDSLLRAGGAQKLFGEAVETSNKAWKENTALTKEAETRYGTFESQLEVFKNKINVLGIDFGGPFMAAANQVLDILTPFIEKLSELSKKFMEMPESTQQLIVTLTGVALAIGPVTWGVGKLIGSFGSFFTTIGGGMKSFGKWRIESDFVTKSLPKMSSGIKSLGGNIVKWGIAPFKTFGTALLHPINATKSLFSLFSSFGSLVSGGFGTAISFITKGIATLGTNIIFLFTNGFSLSGVFSSLISVFTSFGSVLGLLLNPVTLVIAGIAAIAGGILYLNNETGSFSATLTLLKDKFVEFFSTVYETYIKPAFDAIVLAFQTMLANIKTFWDENGAQFMEALKNFFAIVWTIIQPALGFWSGIFSATFNTIVSIVKVAWNLVTGIFQGVFQIIGGLIKVFTGIMTGDWQKMFDGLKDIASGGWNLIASGVEAFANAFLSVIEGLAQGIQKGIVGAINGVIKAISWVLDLFGQEGIKEWEIKELKIGRVKLPKFATGSNGLPFDTLGVVNDQKGSNFEEMIIPKRGRPFIPKGRDVVLPMEKGTQIIPADLTKQFISGLPHFKKGFFSNFWEGTKNTASSIWGKVKEFSGDVWDYMSDPGSLVKTAIDKFTNIPSMPKHWFNMATGAVKHLGTKMVGYVKDLFDTHAMDSGFDGDDSIGSNGVYSYLMNIAKSLMSKYNMVFTSGFRSGDPYDHGKGLAVDIALPGVVNGSPIYKKAADEAINMPGVKYVITNGMWKHKGKSWVNWPDGDHYDHVHISGEKPTGMPKGDGNVGRWASPIRKAARIMGQNVSDSQVNGILKQIQRESGGNERIVQSSAVWDVNMANGNPARGLLQYIPQTFNAYKMRGYENIMNGLHQLVAFFNNSNWRNDIQYGNSGWGPRGSRIKGYAKGGLIMREQIARIGEGNKPEMVIPLTNESRAIQLINQAKSILGMSDSQTTVVNDNSRLEQIVARLEKTVEQQGQMMIKLLEIIAAKELIVDEDSMTNRIDKKQGDNVFFTERGLA